MSLASGFLSYLVPFLLVLTVLVFIHEMGHYLVARWNRVRVDVFSIGFGPELFGFNDRAGTRWKFSAVPLGGYVKMFGDENAASMPDRDTRLLTPAEQAVSFHHKRVSQRAAIVVAGPVANFLFAVAVLIVVFTVDRNPYPPAIVGAVTPGSAAATAGLEPGDRIEAVDGKPIYWFSELVPLINGQGGQPVELTIDRDGGRFAAEVTPAAETLTLDDGRTIPVYRIGVAAETGPYALPQSAGMAVSQTWAMVRLTIVSIGEMITGDRAPEISGPVGIAHLSGEFARAGLFELVWFAAVLSINLGLINLLPVPLLDGGHLLFYAVEALRGRPLGARAQEYGFRIGLAFVLTLMLFATWSDLSNLRILSFLKNLIS